MNTLMKHTADRNMLKNEIHDIVIDIESINEAKMIISEKYSENMAELKRKERKLIIKLSNL